MTIPAFSPTDMRRLSALDDIRRDNFSILRAFSLLLNAAPTCVSAADMEEMTGDLSGLPAANAARLREFALYGLLCARLSFDPEATDKNRAFAKTYLLPSLSCLDPAVVENDPYVRTVPFPNAVCGEWELRRMRYAPYELFSCDEATVDDRLREIPRIGFFPREVAYPAVLQGGREWMTVTPNEIATMRAPIAAARGRVVTLGLGLGYFAFMASEKAEVEQITVVERDAAVIRLFREHLLPHFPHRNKLTVLHADALEVVEDGSVMDSADLVFADLWHDPSDGLPLYLRLKQAERRHPSAPWRYWLEPTLLSHLRWRVFHAVAERQGLLSPSDEADSVAEALLAAAPPQCYAELAALLTREGLISAISKSSAR